MQSSPSFNIIGSSDQTLQFLLSPHQKIYIAGTVIYGTPDIYSKQKQNKNIIEKLLGKHLILRKIQNDLNKPQFIGVKRSQGKILALNLKLFECMYGNMYVRKNKILAINFDDGDSRMPHAMCKQFIFVSPLKNKGNRQSFVFLQIDNNMCVEKCLGEKETISFQRESLLAFDDNIKLVMQGSIMTAEGPGMVFLNTSDVMKNYPTYGKIIIGIIMITIIESLLREII